MSAGCANCYMFREKARFGQDPAVVVRSKAATFRMPLKWRDQARVFTCSWSDWFIEEADAWRDEAWEIIRVTPWLTYQILTKRPERIAGHLPVDWGGGWHNVWLGVTAENQAMADERIPVLLRTPTVARFVSVEPILGPIQFPPGSLTVRTPMVDWVDWVICGGESGPAARPMHPDWARSLRDQCASAGVPFFFKQWGEWRPTPRTGAPEGLQVNPNGETATAAQLLADGRAFTEGWTHETGCRHMERVGVRAAGRMLDSREWLEFPERVGG